MQRPHSGSPGSLVEVIMVGMGNGLVGHIYRHCALKGNKLSIRGGPNNPTGHWAAHPHGQWTLMTRVSYQVKFSSKYWSEL